ncbi:hypothetical protein NX722_09055 [Endozoicomonas gorgoniicola]|uniref:Uncharacterized protein n=1 Tax=Endozoicomonas gorgoniicola TaxID=1234144 RepID=A0ABT3MTV9_9GAMM|nr:hypothetical protein [Endozoicomonas gorgoniicola]MCW7552788.1 hypothetical protein [Endozoicomonas gorgoniicola]
MAIKYHVRLSEDERLMLKRFIKQEKPRVAQYKKRNANILLAIVDILPSLKLSLYHISTPQNWRAMRQTSTPICNLNHPFQTARQPGRTVCLESHQPPSLAMV